MFIFSNSRLYFQFIIRAKTWADEDQTVFLENLIKLGNIGSSKFNIEQDRAANISLNSHIASKTGVQKVGGNL